MRNRTRKRTKASRQASASLTNSSDRVDASLPTSQVNADVYEITSEEARVLKLIRRDVVSSLAIFVIVIGAAASVLTRFVDKAALSEFADKLARISGLI